MASAIKGKFRMPSWGDRKLSPFQGLFGTALRDGLAAGLGLFCLLAVWMALRANDTAWKIQETLPSKSTTIEEVAKPAVPREAQPGLADVQNLNALPAAPVEGLFENYEGVQLPITRVQDDLTPFQAYKKPFQPVAGRPMVSFVIVDFGLSDVISKSILDNMPGEISLGLSAYSDDPAKWAAASRAYGHEFWVMLPMQTKEFGVDDSGPHTLLVNAMEKQNISRLFNILGQSVGYTGVLSQQSHEFTPSVKSGDAILKQIFGRGLAFAESNTDTPVFGVAMATESGYPYVQNNFWLDEDLRSAAIDRKLAEFELRATRSGKAVAFLHPYPAVMNKVKEWIEGADDKGIQIAPLSAMVQ